MSRPGYEDWERYVVPSADAIISDNPGPANPYTGPVVDCSSWSHVQILFENFDTARMLNVDVNWGTYNTSLLALNSDQFNVGPQNFAQMVLPVRGRTIQITSTPNGLPQTFGSRYAIVGMSHEATNYALATIQFPLTTGGIVMAANTDVTVAASQWYKGKAMLSMSSSAGGPAVVLLEYLDYGTNTWLRYGQLGIPHQDACIPVVVVIPPIDMRLHIFNFATAQTIDHALIPFPD